MPTLDTVRFGAPCWIDLLTTDPDAAADFYGQLFGWTVLDPGPDYGGYRNFLRDGVPVAGCMGGAAEQGFPPSWTVYLAVEDVATTAKKVVEHGGTITLEPMDVMALGKMAVLTDVGGAHLGMWQPGEHKGFGVVAEDGAPGWFELHTRDYEAAVTFYRDVFGWDTHTMGDESELRYTTLGEGDAAAAGVMDASGILPDGVPPHWSVYIKVPNTDAALAKAVELGGTIVHPAEDTPWGRLATAADPAGAIFKLMG